MCLCIIQLLWPSQGALEIVSENRMFAHGDVHLEMMYSCVEMVYNLHVHCPHRLYQVDGQHHNPTKVVAFQKIIRGLNC